MATILERIQYGYDRDSRRSWRRKVLTTGEDYHYRYDGLSQVVASSRGNLNLNCSAISATPEYAETWGYDPTGNWHGYRVEANGSIVLEQDRRHDKGNRLTQIKDETETFLLDRVGRMTQAAPDASGDWTDALKFSWDAWNRIKEVRLTSDNSLLARYSYDGISRRVTRDVEEVVRHTYYSITWKPLEERKDSETTASAQYLWGVRHRDDLVRRDRDSDGGGILDETRYVLMDYYSPSAITDEEGEVTGRYDFSSFSVRRILQPDFSPGIASECDFEFAFQGQFLDIESGLLSYGYRYYSPHPGRWMCKDPLGYSGGLNLYGYIGNDAINFVDRYGLQGGFGDDFGKPRDPMDPLIDVNAKEWNRFHPDYKPDIPPYYDPFLPFIDPTKPTRPPYDWEKPDPDLNRSPMPTDVWAVQITCSLQGFSQLFDKFQCEYVCGPNPDSIEYGQPPLPIDNIGSKWEDAPEGQGDCWQCKQQVRIRLSLGDDSWKKGLNLKSTDFINPGPGVAVAQFLESVLEQKSH